MQPGDRLPRWTRVPVWLALGVLFWALIVGALCGVKKALGAGDLLSLTNTYREQQGMQDLAPSSALSASAQWKAQDVASGGPVSHTDADGTDYASRAPRFGFSGMVGENLVVLRSDGADAAAALAAWEGSGEHQANLLNSMYTQAGVGYAPTPDGGGVWVMDYGTPNSGGVIRLPGAPCGFSTDARIAAIEHSLPAGLQPRACQ